MKKTADPSPAIRLPIITLLTDFSLKDPYAGAMKGAMLGVNPAANIIDITHLITNGNVMEGAVVLSAAYAFFPAGTIHVGVVDPGVGKDRRAILVETERYLFVGPDNGLFSIALKQEKIRRVVELVNGAYHRLPVSMTFHGRDVFGPVAAHLSAGIDPDLFGRRIDGIVSLSTPEAVKGDGAVEGVVVYADSFGNLVTNIRGEDVDARNHEVHIKGEVIDVVKGGYGLCPEGALVAVIGSSGFLEIARNMGSAVAFLSAKAGDPVTVGRKKT